MSFDNFYNSNLNTDFDLRLILPKTEFYPGEVTTFTVEVSNPHGVPVEYLQLILKQTMVATVRGSFKVEQHQIADVVNGPGFSAMNWFYQIQIPPLAQYTQLRSPVAVMANSGRAREIVEIRYNFQVIATQCESFSLKSEEYPVKIVDRRQPASNPGIQEVTLPAGTMSDVPISGSHRREMRRRNTLPAFTELYPISNLLHPGGSHGRRGNESVSPPPRYSMLSLISSASVETGKVSDSLT